jgi:hypothetical protein
VILALLPPAAILQAQGPDEGAQPDPRALLQFRSRRLKEGLALSDAQADAIAQRWGRFDQEHFARQRQIAALRLRFNDILLGPEPEERKSELLKPLVAQFLDLRRQQEEARHRFEDDIRAGLTPAQQARLILMVDDLNQKILNVLRERRREQRGF